MSETLTTTTKRHRDHAADSPPETPKRLRNSYINNEQQETTQYLLDFFTESDPFLHFAPQPEPDPDNNLSDNEKERVIRHLFEASDDELGIPSRVGDGDVIIGDDDVTGGGDGYFGDFGLWEFEDEAANYYTLLQSELFMQ